MIDVAQPPPVVKFTPAQWLLVLILAAMNFAHILDFVIIMPLGDTLRKEMSINPQQIGFIVAIYGLTATVAGLGISSIIDRFDRKNVLLISFVAFTFATAFCGIAVSYETLLVARGLAGAAGGVVASTLMAMIGDAFENRQRGRAIGIVTASFAVASIAGLPIGLLLAQWFHRGVPFLAIAGLCVPIFVLALWKLPTFKGHVLAKAARPLDQLWAVVKQPRHLLCFVFMYALVLGTFTVIPYLAPYFQANCGLPADQIPIIYSVAGCVTLVSMIIIGQLTDRIGQWPVFLFFASGAIVMAMIITRLPAVNLIGACLATTGFMVMASGRIVPAQAMMLRVADPALRGAFTNLNSAVSHLATGTAPLISGAIVGEIYEGGPLTNYGTAGLVAAGFGLMAIILSYWLRPKTAPVARTARTPVLSETT